MRLEPSDISEVHHSLQDSLGVYLTLIRVAGPVFESLSARQWASVSVVKRSVTGG